MRMLREMLKDKPEKQGKPKGEKKSLVAVFGGWIMGLLLDALKTKWNNSIWEPDK